MGAGWLNLVSFILGLIAWALPIVSLVKRKIKNWRAFSAASVSACAIALCLQIFYTNHLVRIEDWAALMDTNNAVARVSAILLVITLVLNAISLAVHMRKSKESFTL